jgi:hypothetical protein
MRWTALAVVLLVVVAGLLWAEKAPQDKPAVHKGLVIHEWGVFRVHDDVSAANADMRAEWDGLPKFIYGNLPGQNGQHEAPHNITVFKPVIFVHSPKALEMDVHVSFPGGMPVVWWPSTINTLQFGLIGGDEWGAIKRGHSLKWHLFVKGIAGVSAPGLESVAKDHWYAKLRNVQVDDVWVAAAPAVGRGGKLRIDYEREKFVYYDGLPGNLAGVRFTFVDGKPRVSNPADYPVLDLTIVDRRSADHVKIARLEKLDAKVKGKPLEFVEVKAKNWLLAETKKLLEQLKKTGLHEDEAQALVDIWEKEFFQSDGISAFFRLPQEQYERLLPMTLNPKPEHLVRVGLVHQPHCEPDLAERIARIVKDLDDDRFDIREQAQAELERIGPAALGKLKVHFDQTKSPEVMRRLEKFLSKHDANKAMWEHAEMPHSDW